MSNINRDYLVILNPKTSKVTVPELNYYIYDKYTANLFVNLVTTEGGKVINLPDADQYKLVLHVLKPTNEIQTVENIQVFNKEKALFQIELDQELTKNIGRYKCELLTVDKTDHITQSVKFSYRVKKSIYNDLDVVTETPQYPIIINLLNKLQDIDKYEEERRANEVARVAAEKARVKDYTDLRQTVTTDIETMQEKIDSFDGKVQEVDNAVQQMTTNIDKYQTEKNKELDNYKTQKDTQINTAITDMENTIDTYKTEKDTQLNDKITQQDNKIDSAINLQNKNIQASTKALNDKLDAAVQDQNNTIEANNQAQNKVINDAITEQNKTINSVVENDKAQDASIKTLKYNQTACIKSIKQLQDKDAEHENRMTAIEAVDVEQNNRLDAIEIKNDQQDSRLNDVEAKNKKQDLDLKCLFAESHSERITLDDEVGNSVFLQNSKQGFATVDELKGNTLVNCNKDTDKELILNGNIDTSGYGTVTTTEGVDGGKVDVALEGNTMVNVCDQEEPVAITKSYTVETGNHIALQGEYDGKCRPNIYGNTLVNLVSYSSNIIVENNSRGMILLDLSRIKTNQLYTVVIKMKNNTLDEPIKFSGWTIYNGYNTDGVPHYWHEPMSSVKVNDRECFSSEQVGEYKTLIGMSTITSDKNSSITLFADSGVTGRATFDCIVLEGDYTNKPTPDYFTGMKSSFEDKLITDENDANNGKYKVDYKVTGKNKCPNKFYSGWIQDNNYSLAPIGSIDNILSTFIRVNKNTYYVINDTSYQYVFLLDENKNYMKTINITNGKFNSQNASYVIIGRSIVRGDITEDMYNNIIQIEEGTTATTYEPYKESIKTLYLNSPLLEGDTIEQSGNNIIHNHRYGKVVLDGSDDELWYLHNNTGTNCNEFRCTRINNKDLPIMTSSGVNSLCDRYITASAGDKERFAWAGGAIYISILKTKMDYDLNELREYLNSNPITCIGELATPTQEIISTNDNLLLDSYTNGHLDVDTVVPIDKVDFKAWGCQLKYLYPSTEYTIQFESDNVGKIDYIYMTNKTVTENISVIKGINKINITTNTSFNSNWFTIIGIGFNMSKIVVTPKVDNDFGYFKGMKSVGECEGNKIEILSSNNTLLIDNEELKVKGELYYTKGWSAIKINKNVNRVKIVITNKDGLAKNCKLAIKNDVESEVNMVWLFSNNTAFTTIEKDYDLKGSNILSFCTVGEHTMDNDFLNYYDIKVYSYDNLHDLASSVKQNKKEILLNEPLRGLPNEVKDKYVIIDGKWYIERNCGMLSVNDNKDGWTGAWTSTFPAEGTSVFSCKLLSYNSNFTLCDKYKNVTLESGEVGCITARGAEGTIGFRVQNTTANTLEQWKEYLKTNDIKILYALQTPTYEPIDYNPFEVYTDITHISNNSTIPCNMVIKNTGFNCMLKPNTTYTVSSNNGLSSVVTKDSIGDSVLRFYDKDTTSVNTMKNALSMPLKNAGIGGLPVT